MNATYPETPGYKETHTSKDAATFVANRTSRARAEILERLRREPATTDETASAMSESILFIRPRFSELRALGKIEPSGKRRCNASGCTAWVWKVTELL